MKLNCYASGSGALSFTWEYVEQPSGNVLSHHKQVTLTDVIEQGLAIDGYVLWYQGNQPQMFRPVIRKSADTLMLAGEEYRYELNGHHMQVFASDETGEYKVRNLSTIASLRYYVEHEVKINKLPGYPLCCASVQYSIITYPYGSDILHAYYPGADFSPTLSPPVVSYNRVEAERLFENVWRNTPITGDLQLVQTTDWRYYLPELEFMDVFLKSAEREHLRRKRALDLYLEGGRIHRKTSATLAQEVVNAKEEMDRIYRYNVSLNEPDRQAITSKVLVKEKAKRK